ncbi:MAG: hypothetical protein N2442_11095 [Spirochaetes bacterium]|nr:hypothetical protein [Spirochaetota bacterium]
MKNFFKWGGIVLLFSGFFVSCASVSSKLPGIPLTSGVSLQPQAITGGVDFRDGEVLCATGTDPYKADFYLARIVTQASPSTKNQAEVVYVRDGKKEWVNFVFPSRKATKQDLGVGKVLFVPVWHREQKEISDEDYRKGQWELGRVTSVDDLFKDIVEVNGLKYYWQYLRVPEQVP